MSVLGWVKYHLGIDQVETALFYCRVELCDQCRMNEGGVCGMCGCPVFKKAAVGSEKCPLGVW